MKHLLVLLLLAACAVQPIKTEESKPQVDVIGLNVGLPNEIAIFRVTDDNAICYTAQTMIGLSISCIPLPPKPAPYKPQY